MTTATVTRCRIAAKTLKEVVALAASGLPARTNLPVLFNILLATVDGGQTLAATGMDMEIAVKAEVPTGTGTLLGDAGDQFTVCVNGAKLSAFVASLPDHQPVEMEVTDKALVLVCARSRGRFPLNDPEEYPDFPGTKGTAALLTAMGDRVGKSLDAVLPFVAANDKGRPSLMGAYLEVKDGKLTTLGADGFAIGVYRALDDGVPDGKRAEFKRDAALIVSARAGAKLAEVARRAGESRVALALVGKDPTDAAGLRMEAELGATVVSVYARALEGPYPAIGILSVLPKHGEREVMPLVEVNPALLAAAVRRVAPFGADTVYGTPVHVHVASAGYETQGTMTVRAAGAELGEGEDVLDCTAMTGYGDPLPDPLFVGLGSRYILDAIKAIRDTTGAESIFLGFRGANAFTFSGGSDTYEVAVGPIAVQAPAAPEAEHAPDNDLPDGADEDDLSGFAPDEEVEDLSDDPTEQTAQPHRGNPREV